VENLLFRLGFSFHISDGLRKNIPSVWDFSRDSQTVQGKIVLPSVFLLPFLRRLQENSSLRLLRPPKISDGCKKILLSVCCARRKSQTVARSPAQKPRRHKKYYKKK
jgi:hypothetical protein